MPVRVAEPAPADILCAPSEAQPSAVSLGLVQWGAEHGPANHAHTMREPSGLALNNHYDRIKSWLRTFVA